MTTLVTLPGTRKLSTTCSLRVGKHSLSLNAFVVRHPDENAEKFHRRLLERNLKLYGVSYAIDRLGDVYLTAKLPLSAVSGDELDRLLGAVLEEADGSFNTLLELGFAKAIRKEYAWRVARGESTRNLAAFTHLTGESDGGPAEADAPSVTARRLGGRGRARSRRREGRSTGQLTVKRRAVSVPRMPAPACLCACPPPRVRLPVCPACASSGGSRGRRRSSRQLTKTDGLPDTLVSWTGPYVAEKKPDPGHVRGPVVLVNFWLAKVIVLPVLDVVPLRPGEL